MPLRLSAIIPFALFATALALCATLLSAGATTNSANNYYWLSLNTSKLGQDLIQVQPVDPSSSDDPLGPFGDLLDDIFPGLIGNITNAIDGGLQDLQGAIVGNLTKALGLKDTYTLYLNTICQGDYENADDPDSRTKFSACTPYSDSQQGLLNITNSIPSHFVVGVANVSIPLVDAVSSTLVSTTSLAKSGAGAMFVLLIIGACFSGLAMLGSGAGALLARQRLLVIGTTAVAILADVVLLLTALAATGIIVGGSSTVAGLGAALGMHISQGVSFLVMAWVAAACAVVGATYWFAVWFVEVRQTMIVRRWRPDGEIGDWKGTWGRSWRNLRLAGAKEA